MECHS